jgi:hypothetical protein
MGAERTAHSGRSTVTDALEDEPEQRVGYAQGSLQREPGLVRDKRSIILVTDRDLVERIRQSSSRRAARCAWGPRIQ